jgi:hypothetical protein
VSAVNREAGEVGEDREEFNRSLFVFAFFASFVFFAIERRP